MGKKRSNDKERERLQALVEEGTVDCYTEEEAHTGLATMVSDEVQCPFQASVIGEEVEVTGFELSQGGYGLFAVCKHKGKEYKVDVNSLEWIKPYPKGFEWIEAYLFWQQGR